VTLAEASGSTGGYRRGAVGRAKRSSKDAKSSFDQLVEECDSVTVTQLWEPPDDANSLAVR
jgi:hypothetical protein